MDIFGAAKRRFKSILRGARERVRAKLNPQSIQDATGQDYGRYLARASAELFERALDSLKNEGEIWAFKRNGSSFSVAVIDRYPRIFDLKVITSNTPKSVIDKTRGEGVALAGGEPVSEIKARIRLTLKHLRDFSDASDSAPRIGGD